MKSNTLCDQWADTFDRALLGEPISDEQHRFQREHEATCALCAEERGAWASLPLRVLPAPLPAPAQRTPGRSIPPEDLATLAKVRARLQAAQKPPARARWSVARARWYVGAGSLAAAACLALFLSAPRFLAPAAPVSPVMVEARMTLIAGEIRVDGRSAAAGTPLTPGASLEVASGRACLRVDPGVSVCLTPGSRAHLTRLERGDRRLELSQGALFASLDPQPAGTSFTVATRAGTVTAVGTAFSVDVPEGEGPVITHVLHGVVAVRAAANDAEVRVARSERVALADGKVSPLPAAADPAEAPSPLSPWDGGAWAAVEVTSRVAGALVTVDGVPFGPAPLSALIAPGAHRLALQVNGESIAQDVIDLAPEERFAKMYPSEPPPTDARTASPSASPSGSGAAGASPAPGAAVPGGASPPGNAPRATASDLLRGARAARAEGRYAEAAAAYRSLQKTYPTSGEAQASLVSLAELELSHLGHPEQALRRFDAYLASGGALAQEARYGRIRALRALGRTKDERAAINAFLAAYPTSVQSSALRERLQAL